MQKSAFLGQKWFILLSFFIYTLNTGCSLEQLSIFHGFEKKDTQSVNLVKKGLAGPIIEELKFNLTNSLGNKASLNLVKSGGPILKDEQIEVIIKASLEAIEKSNLQESYNLQEVVPSILSAAEESLAEIGLSDTALITTVINEIVSSILGSVSSRQEYLSTDSSSDGTVAQNTSANVNKTGNEEALNNLLVKISEITIGSLDDAGLSEEEIAASSKTLMNGIVKGIGKTGLAKGKVSKAIKSVVKGAVTGLKQIELTGKSVNSNSNNSSASLSLGSIIKGITEGATTALKEIDLSAEVSTSDAEDDDNFFSSFVKDITDGATSALSVLTASNDKPDEVGVLIESISDGILTGAEELEDLGGDFESEEFLQSVTEAVQSSIKESDFNDYVPVIFAPKDTTPPSHPFIAINAGEPFTSKSSITLRLSARKDPVEMLISADSDCMAGQEWVSYKESMDLQLPIANGENVFSVKFRDDAKNESTCASAKIIHDSIPPAILSLSLGGENLVTASTLATISIQAEGNPEGIYLTRAAGCSALGDWNYFASSLKVSLNTNSENIFYIKLVDAAGNESKCESISINQDKEGPSLTNDVLTVSNLSPTSFTLSWQPASDIFTPTDKLKYQVIISQSGDLKDFPSIRYHGTPVSDLQENTFSMEIDTLASLENYFVNVIGQDQLGNFSHYKSRAVTTTGSLWIREGGTLSSNATPTFAAAKGVAHSDNFPGGVAFAMNWGSGDSLYVFGGGQLDNNNQPIPYNTLWKLNTKTMKWTWLHGNQTPAGDASYGTKGTAHADNTPGARLHGSTWKDQQGKFWLFGGYGKDSTGSLVILNDLWKYDPTTNLWTWMGGSNEGGVAANYGTINIEDSANTPGSRFLSNIWTSQDGTVWLFGGGSHLSENKYHNDLWKFNPANGNWTWVAGSNSLNNTGTYGTKETPSTANIPYSRASSQVVMDSAGMIWLFGGQTVDYSNLNDLWRFNPSNQEWTWIKGSNSPGEMIKMPSQGSTHITNEAQPTSGHSMWIDAKDRIFVFGGTVWSGVSNDLYMFDPSSISWTWLRGNGSSNGNTYFPGTIGQIGEVGLPKGTDLNPLVLIDTQQKAWVFGGLSQYGAEGYGASNALWSYQHGKTNAEIVSVLPPLIEVLQDTCTNVSFAPRNYDGVLAIPANPITVSLTSSTNTGLFYQTPNCDTVVESVTIDVQKGYPTLFYKNSNLGERTHNYQVDSKGYQASVIVYPPITRQFTTTLTEIDINVCTPLPVDIRTLDGKSLNPLSKQSEVIVGSGKYLTVYDNDSCGGGPFSGKLTLNEGTSSFTVYLKLSENPLYYPLSQHISGNTGDLFGVNKLAEFKLKGALDLDIGLKVAAEGVSHIEKGNCVEIQVDVLENYVDPFSLTQDSQMTLLFPELPEAPDAPFIFLDSTCDAKMGIWDNFFTFTMTSGQNKVPIWVNIPTDSGGEGSGGGPEGVYMVAYGSDGDLYGIFGTKFFSTNAESGGPGGPPSQDPPSNTPSVVTQSFVFGQDVINLNECTALLVGVVGADGYPLNLSSKNYIDIYSTEDLEFFDDSECSSAQNLHQGMYEIPSGNFMTTAYVKLNTAPSPHDTVDIQISNHNGDVKELRYVGHLQYGGTAGQAIQLLTTVSGIGINTCTPITIYQVDKDMNDTASTNATTINLTFPAFADAELSENSECFSSSSTLSTQIDAGQMQKTIYVKFPTDPGTTSVVLQHTGSMGALSSQYLKNTQIPINGGVGEVVASVSLTPSTYDANTCVEFTLTALDSNSNLVNVLGDSKVTISGGGITYSENPDCSSAQSYTQMTIPAGSPSVTVYGVSSEAGSHMQFIYSGTGNLWHIDTTTNMTSQ